MKKYNPIISSFMLLILLLCTSFTSSLSVNAANDTYVALGDSITAGTGMSDPENTFVSQFAAKLDTLSPGIVTYNLGKEGDTINDTLEKVQQTDTSQLLHNASYITITAGGNDILAIAASAAKELTGKNYKKATKIPNLVKNEATAKMLLSYLEQDSVKTQLDTFLENFAADFHNLITTVQTKSPSATILVQTVYNPVSGSSYHSLSDCIDLVVTQVNAIIQEEVYEQNNEKLLLCDTYSLFQNKAEQFIRIEQDDIHPTAEGHKKIAEALMQTLSGETTEDTKSEAAVSTAESTPALSEHASAQPANNQQSGKNRFLTWSASSFICGLFALMLFKIFKSHT